MPEPKVRQKPVRSKLSKAASEAVKTQQELDKELVRGEALFNKLEKSREKLKTLRVAAVGAEARWQALRKPVAYSNQEQAGGPNPGYTGAEPEDLESEDDGDIEGSDEDPEE